MNWVINKLKRLGSEAVFAAHALALGALAGVLVLVFAYYALPVIADILTRFNNVLFYWEKVG